jgi:acyl-CoA reductase-like NAD-dependent aldehyde dehydrogenase
VTSTDKKLYIALAVALALVAVIAFVAGRSCDGDIVPVIDPGGIDAGPGEREIAERLDGALQQIDEQIANIERKHQEDLEAFNEEQRREYERVRQMSPEEVARWLNEWNATRRRPDRGTP